MILFVILLFGLAVGFGVFLMFMGIRYKRGSKALGLTHAAIGMLALVMLIVQIFREATIHMLYNNAAILFFMALAGGLVLLALRKGTEPPPMVVVVIHAVMALVALALLVVGYLHR
ncbi:MAG: hypothetical protein PVG20_10200 [Thioalkalispiraceae bacterium]|jgi:hypothetical protein